MDRVHPRVRLDWISGGSKNFDKGEGRKTFKSDAVIGITRIYSTYDSIHSVAELRHVIDELFTHR